ncbi:FAD-dependent oxidoreductase [Maricurvus nonylphenolicus]|uniref:FAD-dependent oxidoreductase n=1 Tax=Maricurvus nonylphenolicus TaxID=1008307 RepID=UPI0036F3F4BD
MTQKLLLIGGGHSHAIALNLWAKQPLPDVEVTLISPQQLTPYSGMLPGLVAGHYTLAQTHIHLPALCRKANARFIEDCVTGIDTQAQNVVTASGQTLAYDRVSINCGITPATAVPGAAQFAIGVKPIAEFYPRWQSLLKQLEARQGSTPFQLLVVGGGAAGVELILAMHHYLTRSQPQHLSQQPVEFTLIQSGKGLPEGYPQRLQHKVQQTFADKGIRVLTDSRVTRVEQDQVIINGTKAQQAIAGDAVFWCTQAGAADWPQASGLITDKQGFIRVNQHLQSLNATNVFACGDIASQESFSTPKAGVFAVRQGPLLFHNLHASLQGKPLQSFQPQAAYLSLLAAGDRYGWGCRIGQGLFPTLSGHWVWRWKDRIDRRFMAQFPNGNGI